jgi:CheY-like chemotaxis protein
MLLPGVKRPKKKHWKSCLILFKWTLFLKGEINGIEAVSEINKLNNPVIYLTAHSEESTIERAKLTMPYGIY